MTSKERAQLLARRQPDRQCDGDRLRAWPWRLVGRAQSRVRLSPAVARLPALTAPKFKVEGSSGEIDRRVRDIVRDGLSVYRVDADAWGALAPDLIVTQDHCDVCAVSLRDVEEADLPLDRIGALRSCPCGPIAWPTRYADIGRVGRALAAEAQGAGLVAGMEQRLRALAVQPVRRIADRGSPSSSGWSR